MTMNKLLNDKVDRERWQVAQSWEQAHWIRNQKALAKFGKNYIWKLLALIGKVDKYRGDDRNGWWKESFDGYRFLPREVDNALEVGCGPYTNLRLISEICKPQHFVLSDPLISTYVKFKMTFVNEMYRKAGCTLDGHPIEELPFADKYFNLAVMINVLDHVQDARQCAENFVRVVKPGGWIIFGQDLTDDEDIARQPEGLQTGHPITMDEDWCRTYITDRFEPVVEKVLSREAGWAPQWHYGTYIFAGRKR